MSVTNYGVPKTHPASRELLPGDPLEMHSLELPGDPDLMLRLLVEEYARAGWESDGIMQLARNPNYRAFHGLWQMLGDDELQRRVKEIIERCGVMKVKVKETEPVPEPLVQLDPVFGTKCRTDC